MFASLTCGCGLQANLVDIVNSSLRFGELRHDIPRISARVLSARLRELETRGVLTRRLLDTSPPSAEYELTELGQELLPALDCIVKIGMKLKEEPAATPRRRLAA